MHNANLIRSTTCGVSRDATAVGSARLLKNGGNLSSDCGYAVAVRTKTSSPGEAVFADERVIMVDGEGKIEFAHAHSLDFNGVSLPCEVSADGKSCKIVFSNPIEKICQNFSGFTKMSYVVFALIGPSDGKPGDKV
jgi:hypothetical protein